MGNERGIALIITLLVVALLTITVIDFTYSVQIDQHMAHNALNGLQASLLARSGINVGEAFLLHDNDPQVDAYTEDWCPDHENGTGAAACSFDAAASQLVIPENMRLRVQVIDEGGKLNINMTRPPNVNEWRAGKNNQNQERPFQTWKAALGQLLSAHGADPSLADTLDSYWDQLYTGAYGQGAIGGTPGPTTSTPGTTGQNSLTPTPGNINNAVQQQLWDFPSLDDVSVIPGFTPSVLRRIRSVVTALPFNRAQQVNVNTASPEVLTAIIGDASAVEGIVSQRATDAIKQADLGSLLAGINKGPNNSTGRYARQMLTTKSFYFLIRASAVINPNPLTGRGGVGRTAAMLVRRDARPGLAPNAPAGTPRWTLTRLDWQKEGGAALFQQKLDQEPGADDLSNPDSFGMVR